MTKTHPDMRQAFESCDWPRIFHGSDDWHALARFVHELEAWNTREGKLDLKFFFYDGEHRGSGCREGRNERACALADGACPNPKANLSCSKARAGRVQLGYSRGAQGSPVRRGALGFGPVHTSAGKTGRLKHATPPKLLSSLVLATLAACGSQAESDRAAGVSSSSGGAAGAPNETSSSGAAGFAGATQTPVAPCPTYDPDSAAVQGLELLHPADRFEVYVIDADAEWVYFVEGEQLRRVLVAGGAVETLGPLVASWVRRLGEDELLWAQAGSDAGAQRLLRAPLTNPEDISVVVESTPQVSHVVVDDTHVCWSTTAPYDVYRASHGGGDPELLVAGAQPLGAVLHAGYYYWIDAVSDHLERVLLPDGTREKLTPVLFGGPMAAHEGAIFWGDTVLSSIEKWSADTGRVQLAFAIDPLQLQIWDDTLYWSQGLLSGAVRSVGVDGDDPRDLLCRLRPRTSFRITDDHVLVGGGSGLLRLDR